MTTRVLDFYERPGCHLCVDALAVVEQVAAEFGAQVRLHDIDADEALQRAYGERIPVVLIDGEPHAQWFVDEARLREALR